VIVVVKVNQVQGVRRVPQVQLVQLVVKSEVRAQKANRGTWEQQGCRVSKDLRVFKALEVQRVLREMLVRKAFQDLRALKGL
jgi:hypothetical protein